MAANLCDGQTLKTATQAGKRWLEQHYERVNQLNVFPIPDGDTGINMLLTLQNACDEIETSTSHNVSHIARQIAHGAIMGSRGNSGTIMSRIWSGFAQALGVAETFDVKLAAQALREASSNAYRGVQTPTEGTILTVIREIAEEAEKIQDSTDDLHVFLEKLVERGWDAVRRTPDMLPILKQSGVVDSGGSGLMYFVEGMLKHANGEVIEDIEKVFEEAVSAHNLDLAEVLDPGESGYNYDVQFVIKGSGLNVDQVKTDIEAMGDSAVIVGTDSLVKVHVHVDDPSIPLGYAVKLGILTEVVVENMQEQYETFLREKMARQPQASPLTLNQVAPGEIGVVAVAAGDGLAQAFADLGVAGIVKGGQTNNPSTEEILAAVRSLNTDKVIVLPNNKNIILAAEQAAQLIKDIQIQVVPTRTFPQGIAAMLPYRPDDDLATVVQEMNAAKDQVVTIEITTATRTVEIDGVAVADGQIIGLIDGKLRVAGENIEQVLQAALAEISLSDYSLVSLYYGEGVSQPDAETLTGALRDQHDSLEFEVFPGGQPHYHYIIGIE